MVRCAAGTGLRQGELLALSPRRIELAKRRVTVAESLSDVVGTLKIGPTKNDQTRSVTIAESLLEPLERQLAERKGARFVWPNRDGGPLRGNLLYRRHFLPAAGRTGLQVEGLPNVRFHDLPHTYAALLIALNAPPKAIQNWMGHSSISVTFATFAGFASASQDWAQGRGCLLCNTATERSVLDPACGDHVDAYFERLTNAFRNALQNGQHAGEISETADLDDLAAFFTMSLIGIATLAKGRAQPNQIHAACRVVTQTLKTHEAATN